MNFLNYIVPNGAKNSTIVIDWKKERGMKSCIVKTAVLALAVSLFSLLGCETVVTDVNAELAAIYPEEDLGIPVKLNENYIEVAYNPASTSADEVSDDIEDDTDVKETENTEAVSAAEDEKDIDAEITSDNDTDTDENSDETDGEDALGEDTVDDDSQSEETDGEDVTGEDSDTGNEGDSDTENGEENAEEDLNASMAEENFDAEFYAATYPDVVSVFGNSPEALYKHYKDYGKAEGRSCNAEEFALLNESTN